MDSFADIPDIWKTTELSMIDTCNGENTEIKAEFDYQKDSYKPFKTMIIMKNAKPNSEDRRIISYDSTGSIKQDRVTVISPVEGSSTGYGMLPYELDPQTGQYISITGAIYQGQVANDGILDKVNMLAEQSEKFVTENSKRL